MPSKAFLLTLSSFSLLLATVSGYVLHPLPSLLSREQNPSRTALSAFLPPPSSLFPAPTSPPPALTQTFASSPFLLSETESWVAPVALSGDVFLNLLSFLMLCRVVISWYPKTDLTSFPYSLVVFPTEWLLRPTRGIVPPAFGVDVSPIVWLAISTFLHEIFLGQQVRQVSLQP